MKIMSKKQYEKMQQCMVDLQMDLNQAKEENAILEKQVEYLRGIVKANELLTSNKDKEIKRLKQLCTRNNVNYKKEDKDGRK